MQVQFSFVQVMGQEVKDEQNSVYYRKGNVRFDDVVFLNYGKCNVIVEIGDYVDVRCIDIIVGQLYEG